MTTFRESVLVLVRASPFNYGLVLASLYFLDPPRAFGYSSLLAEALVLTFWATALAWVFVLFLWLQYGLFLALRRRTREPHAFAWVFFLFWLPCGLFLALHRRREPHPLECLPALLENLPPLFRRALDQREELPWARLTILCPSSIIYPSRALLRGGVGGGAAEEPTIR